MGNLTIDDTAEKAPDQHRLLGGLFDASVYSICSQLKKLQKRHKEEYCPLEELEEEAEKYIGEMFDALKTHFPGLKKPSGKYLSAFWKYCTPDCEGCEILGREPFKPKSEPAPEHWTDY